MSQPLSWFFSAAVMLAVSTPLQALNYEVGGCKTGAGYVNFTTISGAVAGVPAGATIQVCPGVYRASRDHAAADFEGHRFRQREPHGDHDQPEWEPGT